MSLHFTLAKKVLAHAKDLLKHIFNEAGQDIKAAEKQFLEALKGHAEDELKKAEEAASSGFNSLQHWQRAPRPEDATSINAAPDLSFDDKEYPEDDEEDEGTAAAPTEDEAAEPTASAEPSEKPENAESAGDKADGETTEEETPPAEGLLTHPAGDAPSFGDPDQPEFAQPARTPPTTTDGLPTEGAADVHGEALPSSAIQSQSWSDEGGKGAAGSELDLPKEQPKEEPKADEGVASDTAPDGAVAPAEASDAPLGGQAPDVAEDAAKSQSEVPALNGGLDVQEGEGKPASDADAQSAPSGEAAASSEKSEEDQKVESEAKPS